MDQAKLRIGIVGCGNISPQYFEGCRLYDNIEVTACADRDEALARQRAKEFSVPRDLPVDALLQDPDIDIVLNLTPPQLHAPLNLRILQAGKHAYCEKPFATNRAEAAAVLALARAQNCYVGCAPDTFLSAPMQAARQALEDGLIGRPFAAMAAFACPGHESWHPNPAFYYQLGGGPLLDMGPYYLTVLANLFGPATAVTATANQAFSERVIGSQRLKGQRIPVETPTHYNGLVEFESGVIATTLFSFDVQGRHELPMLSVYGTKGNLALPDPNRFDGKVLISAADRQEWQELPIRRNFAGARGLGLSEMARAIAEGRPMRASGELAYHALDIMLAHDDAAKSGAKAVVTSRFERLPVMERP